jgi:hypothetical protein
MVDDQNYFVQFDVSALLVGDFSARASFLREMWNLGVFSTNEVRQQLGYNPVDGGDIHLVPMIETQEHLFLKTIIPSRKANRFYTPSALSGPES